MRRPVRRRLGAGRRARGQAIAEFAIVIPIFLMVLFGIIVLGLWVFYQQQLANVAREGARFAAIHSSTAPCPTSGWRDPQAPPTSYAFYPYHCDGPENSPIPWPHMTAKARQSVWGTNAGGGYINACWSGYVPAGTDISAYPDYSAASGFPLADYPATEVVASSDVANTFVQCHIGGVDPIAATSSLGCAQGLTTAADDPASDVPANRVTVYACFEWSPPLAGFLMIPSQITMRAVVTETIQRQQ